MAAVLRYYLHIPAEHLLIGSYLPREILGKTVNVGEIIKRYHQRFFHDDFTRLLKTAGEDTIGAITVKEIKE